MSMAMIPDLQASVLCDDVRQERNGKFILVGLFDVIGLRQFPATFQKLCVVNRWCCGNGTFRQRSRLLANDGKTVLVEGKTVTIKLPNEHATATSVEIFVNTRFEESGTYWVEVLLEGDLRLRYPLRVTEVKPKQSSSGTD